MGTDQPFSSPLAETFFESCKFETIEKPSNQMMLKTTLLLSTFFWWQSLAEFLDTDDFVSIQNTIREQIFPTLWCGIRNAAPYSHPGAVSLFYPHLDTCCKNHDQCPMLIGRGECSHGICNPSSLTPILSCECEIEFRNCLKELPPAYFSAEIPLTWIERLQADLTGYIYFELLPLLKKEKKAQCLS